MTKQEIKERIEACEKKLAELREKLAELRRKMDESEHGGKRWKPKEGKKYFFIGVCGEVLGAIRGSGNISEEMYAIGNVFPSEEAAESERERRKVIAELSDYAEGDEAVWDDVTSRHYLCYRNDKIGINFVTGTIRYGMLFFPSREAAKAAIEAVGEERIKKYYLGVKE